MANKKTIVQLASPERKFVKVYQDFLKNKLLSAEEKLVFIALKSFIDFSKDNGGTQGEVYPSMETICELSSLSRSRATKTINKLIEKKIVKKIRRGATKSNIYTISDYADMWVCESVEDMAKIAESLDADPSSAEVHSAKLEQISSAMPAKGKELVSEPSKAHTQALNNQSLSKEQNATNKPKSQAERYSMKELKDFFEYSIMIKDYQAHKADLQAAFDILYEVLNTGKPTVRISGEDKPQAVVAGKLMKLTRDDILYAIDKFHEQTGEIKNTRAYLLTILYHAKDQAYLDLMNLGHRNGHF